MKKIISPYALKESVVLADSYAMLNPGPVVLITSFYKHQPNVLPVAWCMPVDFNPPKVAFVVGATNYSFECILQTKECVINIPTPGLKKAVWGCGQVSGKKVDKFSRYGLTRMPAKKIKAPLIEECIGHLECRVIDTSMVKKYNIFIAEVVYAWAMKGCFKKRFLTEKKNAQLLHYMGNGKFC